MSSVRKISANTTRYAFCVSACLIAGTAPVALNYIVDPYEAFRASNVDKRTKELTEKAHYALWKFAHYKRESEIVVLGDSRARSLRDKYWSEFGSPVAFNFAYGGGTIPEIHSTFLHIKDDPKLKTIVVGIQLRSFDETHKGGMNRVPEAKKATATSVSYLKNWFVTKQSWARLKVTYPATFGTLEQMLPKAVTSAKAADLGAYGKVSIRTLLRPDVCFGCDLPQDNFMATPSVSKGPNLSLGRGQRRERKSVIEIAPLPKRPLPKIFAKQVTKNAGADWKNFVFSERYMKMLEELGQWADKDDTRRVVFVIPPTIVEMQRTIDEYGLTELSHSLRERLAKLGDVIDFDFQNPVTQKIANFTDAYHFDSKIARHIVGQVLAVNGANATTLAAIKKRRPPMTCPTNGLIENAGQQPSEQLPLIGKSCRVWKRN